MAKMTKLEMTKSISSKQQGDNPIVLKNTKHPRVSLFSKSVLDDLRKTFSINAPKSMRRHCNAISGKAIYDQLFIDTIVMARYSELSK